MARHMKRITCIAILIILLMMAAALSGAADSRIKDLASLEGMTLEPLLGYGLVVGLNGTGDGQSADFTVSSLSTMLERLGVTVDPAHIKLKNVAAVLVTAKLDPTASAGSQVDATVSSLGDCSSLEGGLLIMTPLKAADGRVCVLAQGSISIGGFNIRSGANNSFRKNHATVGMIPGGGKVTARLGGNFIKQGRVSWLLHYPDFHTASRVVDAINGRFGAKIARAEDAMRIEVQVPESYRDEPVSFIASMGLLRAESDIPARVVVNERTGTIIVGQNVIIREAAVAHGSLKVEIKTYFDVSQPPSNWQGGGQTVVVPDVRTDVQDSEVSVAHLPEMSTVADVVAVLNEAGATARDIIAILQALKQAGALQAELVIM